MNKSDAGNYTVTFEVSAGAADFHEIERRMEGARQVYNTCLSHCFKLHRGLQANPQWQKNLCEILKLTKRSAATPENKARVKVLRDENRKIERETGLTEYGLHSYALNVAKHMGIPLGSNQMQKAATFAWRAFDRWRFGNAKNVRFKKRGEFITIENKTSRDGLRLVGTTVVWPALGVPTMRMPIIVRRNDKYAEQTFLDRTKFIRLFIREIRGKKRIFIQAIKEGTPPLKDRKAGAEVRPFGIDLSPSTLVAWTRDKAIIEELAPDCENIDKEIRRIYRAIDRSRRATNPEAYNENGTIKKGAKFAHSKRCEKLYAKARELFRKQAAIRKQSHEKTANRIIALSTNILVEDTPVTSWARRSKKTKVSRKDGGVQKKKRYGKTIAERAPEMLLDILAMKLGCLGKSIRRVDSFKVKASQYDHSSGLCTKKHLSERWALVDGNRVQRDLYSAFLIAHVTGEKLDTIDRDACREDWKNFLKTQSEALGACDRKFGIF